jgi:hypothetical protein
MLAHHNAFDKRKNMLARLDEISRLSQRDRTDRITDLTKEILSFQPVNIDDAVTLISNCEHFFCDPVSCGAVKLFIFFGLLPLTGTSDEAPLAVTRAMLDSLADGLPEVETEARKRIGQHAIGTLDIFVFFFFFIFSFI